MTQPEFHFLYYKNALDSCLARFVRLHEDSFTRADDGRYVQSRGFSKDTLKKEFRALLKSEFDEYMLPFDVENPRYYFVIGGCSPRDNMLLRYRTECRLPKKLSEIVYSDRRLKYVMREQDIVLDMQELNQVFDELFDEMFESGSDNLVMVRHSRLDCYSVFKILKWFFRGQKCVNIYAEKMKGRRENLVAVNDLIDRFVGCKDRLNGSKEFRTAMEEIRQYVSAKTGLSI